MRILFNATTLNRGGAVYLAVSFLHEWQRASSQDDWQFAISEIVARESRKAQQPALPSCEVFDASPARSTASRRRLIELERRLQPDCVFTLAGPAYVRFRAPHLLGCSEGWVTHSNWQAYRALAFPRAWITTSLISVYKAYWFRQADAWVVQTDLARRGLHSRLRLPLDHIHVVPNTASEQYQPYVTRQPTFPEQGAWQILCLAAPYAHKRLDLVPLVAYHLRAQLPDVPCQFVLTLPESSPLWQRITQQAATWGVQDAIRNEGPVAVADIPSLYLRCHVSFIPTVFETFSATYPESMAMGLPMVTSDLPFARDICADAAAYFPAGDARSAAAAIGQIMKNPTSRNQLIASGRARLGHLPSAADQFQRYVSLLRELTPSYGG